MPGQIPYTYFGVAGSAPTAAGTLAATITCYDAAGAEAAGVVVYFRLLRLADGATGSLPRATFAETSNASGVVTATLLLGAVYEAWRDDGSRVRFAVPSSGTSWAIDQPVLGHPS